MPAFTAEAPLASSPCVFRASEAAITAGLNPGLEVCAACFSRLASCASTLLGNSEGSSGRDVSTDDGCDEEAGKEPCAGLAAGAELVRYSGDEVALVVCMIAFG